jgi:cytochrome P450
MISGRNEEYLVNAANFAGDVVISATFIRLIPRFLRPLFAWIFLIPSRLHVYRCSKYLVPLVKERLANFKESEGKETPDMPLDLLSWNIRESAKSSDPKEQTPERLVLRLMVLNFASIHTSTFAATQMLFDLFSSPHASEYVEEIREEISQVLKENGGKWSKAAVAKLVKTDSAIRESLRISTFLAHGMQRLVIGPKGVTTTNGLHLPYRSLLATSTCSIHHDDDVYKDAMTYKAFRFCQPEGPSLPIVTTSDQFLAFGHGRHACPGRFFAAVELKLLMAYILMNYDVKRLETRPKNFVMSATILPPMKATISVKRRKA